MVATRRCRLHTTLIFDVERERAQNGLEDVIGGLRLQEHAPRHNGLPRDLGDQGRRGGAGAGAAVVAKQPGLHNDLHTDFAEAGALACQQLRLVRPDALAGLVPLPVQG